MRIEMLAGRWASWPSWTHLRRRPTEVMLLDSGHAHHVMKPRPAAHVAWGSKPWGRGGSGRRRREARRGKGRGRERRMEPVAAIVAELGARARHDTTLARGQPKKGGRGWAWPLRYFAKSGHFLDE